eukprot:1462982-Amphidinium_carterae.1
MGLWAGGAGHASGLFSTSVSIMVELSSHWCHRFVGVQVVAQNGTCCPWHVSRVDIFVSSSLSVCMKVQASRNRLFNRVDHRMETSARWQGVAACHSGVKATMTSYGHDAAAICTIPTVILRLQALLKIEWPQAAESSLEDFDTSSTTSVLQRQNPYPPIASTVNIG